MPIKNEPDAQSQESQNQGNARSGDPADGDRLSGKPGAIGKTAVEKPERGDPQSQPTPEEFGERGMGMAAKE